MSRDRFEEADRHDQDDRSHLRVAAAVSGMLVVVERRQWDRSGERDRLPMIRPGPTNRGSTAASVSVRGTRAPRPAARTASRAVANAQPITAAAGSQS